MCSGAFLQRELGDHMVVSEAKFLHDRNCVCEDVSSPPRV